MIPYNLIIEVKDGGDNPNNRSIPEYRAKQISKEKMITNNDFGQLLSMLAELKKQVVDKHEDEPLYRIND